MKESVGKYQLVRRLAKGGMAEVFLAKAAGPMGFEKTLVLKRILPSLAEEPTFVEMFLSEARLAAQLTHPNIVQIFDFGEAEGSYFLAMEYIDGPSLRTLVRRVSASGVLLPPAVCARIIASACEGLAFAHDLVNPQTGQPMGLIHRDVSPENILLSMQGAVKLVDFGIAKVVGQSHRTQSGIVRGKLAYMPPEQIRARPLDRRVDVYGLGAVLYELLTGSKLFGAKTGASLIEAILREPLEPAVQRRPDLPEALQRILDQALSKDRDQRYPDCVSLQAALEDFILSQGRPVTTQKLAEVITVFLAETAGAKSQPVEVVDEPATVPADSGSRDEVSTSTPSEQARQASMRGARRVGSAIGAAFVLLVGGVALGWRLLSRPEPSAPAMEEPRVLELVPLRPEPVPQASVKEAASGGETAALPDGEPTPAERSPADAGPEESAPLAVKQEEPVASPVARRRASTHPKPAAVGKGTLVIRIHPYATVFLDGASLGETPLDALELAPGRYTLKIVNTDLGKTLYRKVAIASGKTETLKVNLFRAEE